jgi:hypothetical protein
VKPPKWFNNAGPLPGRGYAIQFFLYGSYGLFVPANYAVLVSPQAGQFHFFRQNP